MSKDYNNPYQSPNFSDPPTGFSGMNPSTLTQQRVVSILMIIHGALLLLAGFGLLFFAIIFPYIMAQQPNRPNNNNDEEVLMFITVVYGGMSLIGLIPGALQIYAGIRNLSLKGRVLGIVAMSAGLSSMFLCYCFPSALGLFIYGLIIYLNDTTRQAFELGESGMTYDEVMMKANQGRFM